MKPVKKLLAAGIAASLLLGGCASSDTVTTEDAPTDIIKTLAGLSSDSSATEVLDAIQTLITNTAAADDYCLSLNSATETSTATLDTDYSLTTVKQALYEKDLRCSYGEDYYELLQQMSSGEQMLGLMDINGTETAVAYATYEDGGFNSDESECLIQSLSVQDDDSGYTSEQLKASAQNMSIYPLYSLVGASLILQPFSNPEYYNFALTKDDDDYYTLTMTIKDDEAYNEALDEYVLANYGYERTDLNGDGSYVVDIYDTTNVTIAITVDENGVIHKIINNNFNTIGFEDNSINAYNKQTCIINKASEDSESFFTDFFKNVKDGEYKEGGTFTLDVE